MPESERLLGTELFPDLSTEIDRRIASSESRIKLWVIGGVLANLLVAMGAGVPLVFYMGQISRDIQESSEISETQQTELAARGIWMQERMIWEARIENILRLQGYEAGNTRSNVASRTVGKPSNYRNTIRTPSDAE